MGLSSALSRLRRFKNTTRLGNAVIAPAYDGLRTLRERPIRFDAGILRSVARLSAAQKSALMTAYAYQARAEIALDVATCYPGGDYFEFGSAGLCTFRNFIAAFDICSGQTQHFPDVRFYAFDIFGRPEQGSGPPEGDRWYFDSYAGDQGGFASADVLLMPYGAAIRDRCILVPGYFQDTLNDALKRQIRDEKRKIGFAFLDCNIVSSYEIVFAFLADVIGCDKMFIYVDEYFTDPPVARLYQDFAVAIKARLGLTSIYMRNAGSFGALFCLMPDLA
jgi:hypothetical protein